VKSESPFRRKWFSNCRDNTVTAEKFTIGSAVLNKSVTVTASGSLIVVVNKFYPDALDLNVLDKIWLTRQRTE